MSDAAPLDPAVGSSHTNMQATGKNDTSKKNRRKNKFKKAETPVPRGHGQEAVIVPEGEVFLQNDPYLLEDMMKEIEMPEKETLPTPKSRPKKQMVNIKCKTLQFNLNTSHFSLISILTRKYFDNYMRTHLNHFKPVFYNFKRSFVHSDAGKSCGLSSFHQRVCFLSKRTPVSVRSKFSTVMSLCFLPMFRLR